MTFQFNKLHLCGVINNLNIHSTDELEMSLNSAINNLLYLHVHNINIFFRRTITGFYPQSFSMWPF